MIPSSHSCRLLTVFLFLPGILSSVNYDEEPDDEAEDEGENLSSPPAQSEKESTGASQKAASVCCAKAAGGTVPKHWLPQGSGFPA